MNGRAKALLLEYHKDVLFFKSRSAPVTLPGREDFVELSSIPAERMRGPWRFHFFSQLGFGRIRLDIVRGGWDVGFQTNCPERGGVIK